MDESGIKLSVGLYLEITDSEMHGGKGSVGYAAVIGDIDAGKMKNVDYYDYAFNRICDIAHLCGVSEENVRAITRKEYEENSGGIKTMHPSKLGGGTEEMIQSKKGADR